MDREKILEAMRSEFGWMVDVALRSVERRSRRTAVLVAVCVLGLSSVVVSGALIAKSQVAAAEHRPPILQVVDAIHGLPIGSPALGCFARALIACEIDLSEQERVVAIACVGRSGIGLEGEPFLRSALLEQSTLVRRQAVVWYPVVHPTWTSDPVGGPIYEQARLSLAGN